MLLENSISSHNVNFIRKDPRLGSREWSPLVPKRSKCRPLSRILVLSQFAIINNFRGKNDKTVFCLTFGEKIFLPNAICVILHLYRMYSGKKKSLYELESTDSDDVTLTVGEEVN